VIGAEPEEGLIHCEGSERGGNADLVRDLNRACVR
jgi:hypothetical protein